MLIHRNAFNSTVIAAQSSSFIRHATHSSDWTRLPLAQDYRRSNISERTENVVMKFSLYVALCSRIVDQTSKISINLVFDVPLRL